jgi:hypothetical protein
MHRVQQQYIAKNFVGEGDNMSRELSTEEKLWCLEQAIAIVKEAGHGGASNMRDAASVLQSVYQALYVMRQSIMDEA